MRIAFDAKRAFNNTTGLGNYSRTLIAALEKGFPENDYFLFTPKVQEALYEVFTPGATIVLPQLSKHKLVPAYWRSWGLAQQLAQHKVEIFHGLSNELPLNAHRFFCKNVVTIHDVLYLKHPKDFPAFDRFFYALKTKYAAKNADKITVNSTQTKEDLMRFLQVPEKKIEVIPHAINDVFCNHSSKEAIQLVREKYELPEHFILQPGSFLGRKNHALSIAAFASLVKKHNHLFLLFTGGGGNKEKQVLREIALAGLQNKIIVKKNIATTDMPALYSAAEMVLYPSLSEGFGLPILEAFASGVPVITSHGKVFEETGGNGAFYIDSSSVSDMLAAMETLLEHSAKRAAFIANGKLQLQQFSATEMARKTMQLYSSL